MSVELKSLGDLVEAIREKRSNWRGSLWYRGQENADWKLLPSLMRQDIKISESSLLSRFKQSAAMLTSARPNSSFDWIFLMQHYGVPTRLLDWSENPLVAAYFAIENSLDHLEKDAAIWVLRPNVLNQNAHIDENEEDDYIPSFDDDELEAYSTERVRIDKRMKLFPVATIATRNNPRIQAQLGTFTIHHNAKISIEDVGDGTHCEKFVIPSHCKDRIRDDLSLLGVSRLSLFPEMESVGRIIREVI